MINLFHNYYLRISSSFLIMNIHISASELAILTGHNTYRDKSELYVKYWKKHWKEDYDRILKKIQSSNIKAKLPETSSETVQRIAKENNISANELSKLYMASKEKDTGKMQTKKEAVLKSVLSQLPESQKKDFAKAANSVAFTGFGTRSCCGAAFAFTIGSDPRLVAFTSTVCSDAGTPIALRTALGLVIKLPIPFPIFFID